MSCGLLNVTVLLLQVVAACSAPAPLLMQPNQKNQQSQQLLQQQMFQLQQFEGLQRNPMPAQLATPPIIILLQNSHPLDTAAAEQATGGAVKTNANKGIVDEDLDSVIIEADSEQDKINSERVLLLPTELNYARLSIGGVISAIPFLPIEINVPDTIGWAYNGISSIISIFGRLPFASSGSQGGMQDAGQQSKLRSVLHQLEMKKQTFAPLLIVPFVPQVIPIRLPIQV